jgi:hypothetical protein
MSQKLEKLIEGLSTTQAAALMVTVNEISAAARAEFGTDVPLDDICGLFQVRDSVFHGGLDEALLSNALHNLRHNSEAVREHLANTEGLHEAKMAGADVDADTLDADTLMTIKNPHLRMKLARKHGIGDLPKADRGNRRPEDRKHAGFDDVASTINDAVSRMNAARGIDK